MGNVNFYLKAATPNGKSLIYLKYKYQGQVLVYAFGRSIKPANWNSSKQRAKSNKETTPDGKHSVNDLLNNLQKVLLSAYTTEIGKGIPSVQTLKKYLDEFIMQNITGEKKEGPTLFKLAERFINGEIKNRGKDKSKSSLKTY